MRTFPKEPLTIVDEAQWPESDDPHDYLSYARYFWERVKAPCLIDAEFIAEREAWLNVCWLCTHTDKLKDRDATQGA